MKQEEISQVNRQEIQEIPAEQAEQVAESLLTPEMLGQKMDGEIASVLKCNGSKQLEQTEASLGIDQATAAQYRAESGVDGKLAENADEIAVLRQNAGEKMKYGAQNEGYEFSKKYSPLQRKMMAEKILGEREILTDGSAKRRPRHYNDEKSQQIEREKKILSQKGKVSEIDQKIQEQGAAFDKEMEDLKKELLKTQDARRSHLGEIHGEIVGTEQALEKHKNSILGKIGLVSRHKRTIANLETQLQIKRSDFGRVKDQYLNTEKKLNDRMARLSEIKKLWNEDKQTILREIDKLSAEMFAQKQSWKEQTANFYDVQKGVATDYEQSHSDRQIAKHMEQEGAWFLHSVPLGDQVVGETAENNTSLNTRNMKGADKIRLLVAVEPAVSTSVMKRADQDPMYNTGVILSGGEVLAAYNTDTSTINTGLDVRTAKYDSEREDSSVQQGIGAKLKTVINSAPHRGVGGTRWNEIVVKRPSVGAVFLRMNSESGQRVDKKSVIEAMDLATEFGVPVLNIDKAGKARDLITGKEVSQSDLLKAGAIKMTAKERRATVERILSESNSQEDDKAAMLKRADSLQTGERQVDRNSTVRILLDLPPRLVEIIEEASRKNAYEKILNLKAGEVILDDDDLPIAKMKQEWVDTLQKITGQADLPAALNRVKLLNKATDRYQQDRNIDIFAEN